jgi:hypothetical protein
MLGNWTQGFAHAGQTFSHWATSTAPNIIIIISYFGCTGLELRTSHLQSGTLLPEPYNHFQPEWPGYKASLWLLCRKYTVGGKSGHQEGHQEEGVRW